MPNTQEVMVHPRDASTVVLVRPGGDGSFEILLTRRPQEMRFSAATTFSPAARFIETTIRLLC